MKFELTIGTQKAEGKRHRKHVLIRGFDRLEDACAAGQGLAQVQPPECFVAIWTAKHRHHSREILTTTKAAYRETLPQLTESSRRALDIIVTKRKQSDERHAFLNRYPNRAFDVLLTNNTAREAWARNQFAAVAEFFASQGLTEKNAPGGSPAPI